MKKLLCFISVFLIFIVNSQVYAESFLNFDGGLMSNNEEYWVASGKPVVFEIEGSTSEISFGSGEETVLATKQRVQKIKVNVSSSSGVSCTVSNSKSSYYTLSDNTFTLKDNNTATSNLQGVIGKVTCTLPTTSNVINYSKNNYINISLETTDIDVAPETPTTSNSTAGGKLYFGVISESYLNSLNDSPSVTSIKVDDLSPSMTTVEVNKNKVTLKVTQNELASKNKLYLTVDSQKKGTLIKQQEISAGDRSIDLPYGATVIEVAEKTEKKKVIDDLFDDVWQDYGFAESSVNAAKRDPYYFVVNRPDNRSKVSTLKSLSISDVNISFKSDLKTYIATVPYKVSSVTINSVLTDAKSSYVKGYGNRKVSLKEGTNNIQIKVQAENETISTYTIKITREKNDDASLKSITVNDKEIAPKADLLVYTMKVDNDVTKPTIKAVPTDSNAKAVVEKFNDLVEGENEISITVTASNGTKKVYVINIVRDQKISTNSKLGKLEVKGQNINFEPDKTEYKVHINHDVDKLDLVLETDNEKAKYIVTGNKDLKDGSVVKIKVTAEDGETITNYTINVEKEKKPFNILFAIIPAAVLVVGGLAALIAKGKKNKGSHIAS